MSLRTKLLAIVIGLPVAILLLALVMFVRREEVTSIEAVVGVIRVASGPRSEVRKKMLGYADRGEFKAIYLVRMADPRDPDSEAQVWILADYYASVRNDHDRQVWDPELRRSILSTLGKATGTPPLYKGRHAFAVRARKPDGGERSYGFVCHLKRAPETARSIYLVMLVGIVLLVVVFYWLLSTWVIGPLRKLSAAADRIADGDFQVRVDPHNSNDEFGRTIRALNRMALEIGEYQGHLEDRVLTALSRIKKAEQHLTIAQRLAATGKLASGLAHEINNPLGGMKNAVRSLARGDLSPAKTELYLDLIAEGLSRVEQTVKKFLSFTPRRKEPRASDLGDITEKSVSLAMHRIQKKGVQIETDLPPLGTAIVFGDPHELQQVTLNLLLNAADASGEATAGTIRIAVEPRKDEIVLRVADNGAGMSAEDQDRCFDMFFTTKEVGEGSGMGLAVVHNIVTNHGGRIELTSALGEGATFEVFLPRERSAPEAEEPQAPSPAQAPEA